jgi:hypothetical protein
VIGRLGSRAIEIVVFLFALYAFAFVPLGKRTGLEHVKAILTTNEAKEAGGELVEAGDRLKRQVLGGGGVSPIRGEPLIPELRPGTPVQMKLAPAERSIDAGVDASLTD